MAVPDEAHAPLWVAVEDARLFVVEAGAGLLDVVQDLVEFGHRVPHSLG